MAGQAIPEFKDGYPDDAFVISAATQSTEAADTVLFIAPRDLVVLGCDIGYDTDADATCAFGLRRVASTLSGADTPTNDTGTLLSNEINANGTGDNKAHSFAIVETENVIGKGERLVLRGAAGSALTNLHATVVVRPFHVSNA